MFICVYSSGFPLNIPSIHLQVNVADFSGSTWLTMFQEQGETILCKKAQEIGELKEQVGINYVGLSICTFTVYLS